MICNEIKKNGLIYDNYEEGNGLQVGIGDEVVLYFSISGTQKNMCNNIIWLFIVYKYILIFITHIDI